MYFKVIKQTEDACGPFTIDYSIVGENELDRLFSTCKPNEEIEFKEVKDELSTL